MKVKCFNSINNIGKNNKNKKNKNKVINHKLILVLIIILIFNNHNLILVLILTKTKIRQIHKQMSNYKIIIKTLKIIQTVKQHFLYI